MRRILLLLLLLAGVVAQAAQVNIVAGSAKSAVAHFNRDGLAAQAELLEMRVAIQAAPLSGAVELADILIVRDPGTGLFSWRYQYADPDQPGNMTSEFQADSAILIRDGKLVEFQWIVPSLWVRESTERHSTMAEGVASVLGMLQSRGSAVGEAVFQTYREVNIGGVLASDALYERDKEGGSLTAHLHAVEPAGAGWKITLDGPNGDTSTAQLNDQFEIVNLN
jgi:hypothetical protein